MALLALIAAAPALAAIPRQVPAARYDGLWKDNASPFTNPPPAPRPGLQKNPLESYVLLGVSPIGGERFRVTLINREAPGTRIFVESDKPNDAGLEILAVGTKPRSPSDTTVRVKSGSHTATLGFDSKLLALTLPAKGGAENPTPSATPDKKPEFAPRTRPPRVHRPSATATPKTGQ